MRRPTRRFLAWPTALVGIVLACIVSEGSGDDRRSQRPATPSRGLRGTRTKDDTKNENRAARPGPKRASCFRSACHTDLKEEAVVHGPANAGFCDVCHTPDEGDHAWKLVRDEQDLCTFCHEIDSRRLVHDPVGKNNCLECHEPHQSKTRDLLLYEPAELCAECHEKPDHDDSHEPFSTGKCLACHDGHASDHPGLIRVGKNALCLGCHTEFQTTLAAAEFVHTPVEDDCGACHASHGSQEEGLLKKSVSELCLGCHEDVLSSLGTAALQTAERKGVPVRDCLACHDPHVSSDSTLLAGGVREACLSCHEGSFDGVKDSPLQGHRTCTDCHSVHGPSGHGALLGEIPGSVYARFEVEAYSLCFECHSEEGITAEVTTATRFRDGTRNLHRVHVVQPKRGRACTICHEVHGSQRHALLRKSFPYGKGKWALPIGFEILSDRRRCETGCHLGASYAPGPSETEQ